MLERQEDFESRRERPFPIRADRGQLQSRSLSGTLEYTYVYSGGESWLSQAEITSRLEQVFARGQPLEEISRAYTLVEESSRGYVTNDKDEVTREQMAQTLERFGALPEVAKSISVRLPLHTDVWVGSSWSNRQVLVYCATKAAGGPDSHELYFTLSQP